MKYWTIQRRLTYKEYKKNEEEAIVRLGGEVVAAPSVAWWVDCFCSTDFSQILKFLDEHHDEFTQWRLAGVEVKGGQR